MWLIGVECYFHMDSGFRSATNTPKWWDGPPVARFIGNVEARGGGECEITSFSARYSERLCLIRLEKFEEIEFSIEILTLCAFDWCITLGVHSHHGGSSEAAH